MSLPSERYLPSRRTFLGGSAATLALAALSGRRAYAAPSERLNLGVIGAGWRGGQLSEKFSGLPGVNLLAVCDADSARMAELGDKHKIERRHTDMQQVFDDPDIDAVVIATCNHWHCLAAIRACQAGKHVYVEKPLGHDLWQQRQLINAARSNDRVVQIGTQQRSDPMQAELKRFLHEQQGVGKLTGVVASRVGERKPIGRRTTPLVPPATVDYDRWLGPAQDRPIYRDELHYDWHWDWNTGDGELGNWGVHILDDVRNVALRDQAAFPTATASFGGRVLWDDAGNTPNFQATLFESDVLPVVCLVSNLKPLKGAPPLAEKGNDSGYVVYGEGGWLEGHRGGAVAYDAAGKKIRAFKGNGGEPNHYANFVEAVRSNDRSLLNAEVETGHNSTAWCLLANAACRAAAPLDGAQSVTQVSQEPLWQEVVARLQDNLKRNNVALDGDNFSLSEMLAIDPDSERFRGPAAAGANQLLGRQQYRSGFEIPEVEA
ncbi:Inositol 2-dehydrogenase [Pirellulimonas nuda]|uniref:Inositol 2-dehydrogenase n=1 Tax=Pirellulimonas nuda TaxID=2528009 RepID=A0A518DHP1_9BACT|nr:Gfo/Idh/MocA family oxidoreductase [Pirellulimonas nuda]QDU90995.1 Inositol 2-dehydrogenase [Pirellulimonas nuda]